MNKIAALALVVGLGGEIGCGSEAQTPLEKQAIYVGADLREVKEIREELLGKLGVAFEGFCGDIGKVRCTSGNPYSTQCAIDEDESNAYFKARDATYLDIKLHTGNNSRSVQNYSMDARTQDGFSVNCVRVVVDT